MMLQASVCSISIVFYLPFCSDGDKFSVPLEAPSSGAFFGGAGRKMNYISKKTLYITGF